MSVVLSVLALLVAAAALALVLVGRHKAAESAAAEVPADVPDDVHALRQEVAALKIEGAQALRNLAVVRYDAFADTGGRLSWSLALLDDGGNGAVITSINGRSEARTYAKTVGAWTSDQQLSPEEESAIGQLKG